jgi:hypothetical protein
MRDYLGINLVTTLSSDMTEKIIRFMDVQPVFFSKNSNHGFGGNDFEKGTFPSVFSTSPQDKGGYFDHEAEVRAIREFPNNIPQSLHESDSQSMATIRPDGQRHDRDP